MPVYEYRCDKGHTFEVMQRMTDDPVSACETCDSPVQRVFHPVAVHFKGSGFYTTDYARKHQNGAGGESKSSSQESKSSSDKDSKKSSEKSSGKSSSASSKSD
jgi:putative FmdB family regulatory protein